LAGSGEESDSGIREALPARGWKRRILARAIYSGQGLSGIDAKGRVGIPAGLRATLEGNSDGRTLVIARHPNLQCIVGHDRGWLSVLEERLRADEERERAAGREFDYYAAAEKAFGQAEEVPYDSSGRFILPNFMKHIGDLDDLAFFFGAGPFFMIWNPRLLIEKGGADHARAIEGAKFFMREKGLL
jgi:MraZ protein